jgi:hypothetical protein
MILEGIVTTTSADGEVNVAPMGPHVGPDMNRFLLRPFPTSRTYRNLVAHPEGVLHVTDDVLLLARAAVGTVEPPPATFPAVRVRGRVLADACRWYEFRVASLDDSEQRVRVEAEVVHEGRLRDFFGFNRARHAVVEAAILATRTDFLPPDEILAEYEKLAVIVRKTGGDREQEAFEFLRRHVQQVTRRYQGGT